MATTERIELAVAVIGMALFISSEVLSRSKCDANGITDLLAKALKALHARTKGGDTPSPEPEKI